MGNLLLFSFIVDYVNVGLLDQCDVNLLTVMPKGLNWWETMWVCWISVTSICWYIVANFLKTSSDRFMYMKMLGWWKERFLYDQTENIA